jgi:hypothetical protein
VTPDRRTPSINARRGARAAKLSAGSLFSSLFLTEFWSGGDTTVLPGKQPALIPEAIKDRR